ncbi:hypothetical protein ACIRTB_07380 [Streptomyces sp. NPDC101158]|uniref:hypothetical protein n=1 Tax=Streptomyces sp. NPDC101158 TaxID=3366117 RepID=UPI00382C0468
MSATTLTSASTAPTTLPHRLALGVRAIRAFGAAAVGTVLLGSYEEHDERAGVRDPRPRHLSDV